MNRSRRRLWRSSEGQTEGVVQITKREFLKQLGLVSAAGMGGAAFGDEFVASRDGLPPGSCGDPANPWFD